MRRRGLASVYGFIMIYLLVIASLQALSLTLSSGESAEAAAQQAAQVQQSRSLEHLKVSLSQGGNVTIVNDGLITSVATLLLIQEKTGSRTLSVGASLPVGATTLVQVGPSPTSVAVVTKLGDVFPASVGGSSQPSGVLKTLVSVVGGPGVDAQLYQNPSDPTRYFLSAGTAASAFSSQTGLKQWSFDAGQGEVTDVLPLTGGTVYVSDGYYGDIFTSNLYRLSSSGSVTSTYSMRLLRLYTTIEVQYPNNGQPPYPVGLQPVQKGADSLYAYYDGWFLSST